MQVLFNPFALTPGFTGADLANLVNEATLLATRRNAEAVAMEDFTAAIERIIAGHPAVAQVAVIGVPDERLGEVGKAYVVLRPGQSLADKELLLWCREQMANYKVPRYAEMVASLPTNPSGKVLKFELRNSVKAPA